MAGRYTTVSIPTPLAEKMKKKIEGTGFTSLSSFVTYMMREALASMEEPDHSENGVFTKEDEERIKARLRSVGYMD